MCPCLIEVIIRSQLACILQMEDFRMVSSRVGAEGGVALAKALAAGAPEAPLMQLQQCSGVQQVGVVQTITSCRLLGGGGCRQWWG